MYCPLHCHSKYSFFDGLLSVNELVETAKAKGAKGLALTDHGCVGGLPSFYKTCKKNEVKPILGCEFYQTLDDTGNLKLKDNFHVVLLAKNKAGYENLIKLNNYAIKNNFYYKQRTSFEQLEKHNEGIICLSACLAGMIPSYLREGDFQKASEAVARYHSIFGDRFYLELQFNEIADQIKVTQGILKLAQQNNIPIVVTNDIHYKEKKDFDTYKNIYSLKSGTLEDALEDAKTKGEELGYGGKELWIKGERDILRDAKMYNYPIAKQDILVALENTAKIVDSIEDYQFDKKLKMFDMGYSDVVMELKRRTFDGFKKRINQGFIPRNTSEQYLERLKTEIKVIIDNGFADYLVLVADVVNYITANGIHIGPGRGSAVGCLTAFCLGITNVDPVKYGLYFERFINPDRVSLPDIDIDYEDRNKACDLLIKKYGDKVLKIGTFSEMASKSSVQQAFRYFSIPPIENVLTKSFDAKENSIKYELGNNPLAIKSYETDETHKKAFELAMQIESKIKNYGTHASGVAILPNPDAVPLARVTGGDLVCAYQGPDLEEFGYLKLDILGLSNLPAIVKTCEMIGMNFDDLYKLDFESDQKVFEEFGNGNTIGVFQMENINTTSILAKIGKLKTFMDLPLLLSIIRPGLDVETFVKNYNSKTEDYFLPATKEILKESYGVLVYQEQVMRMCRDIASMTMAQADGVRKDIAKKTGNITQHKDKFVQGAINNGHAQSIAENLWTLIESCGEYIFNKSHATAYAIISYFCMYLKVHYPLQFLLCCMNQIDNNPKYFNEARRVGIEFLPLDINRSAYEHRIEDGKIRLGLGYVKGVNLAYKTIEKTRPYNNFEDFMRKIKGHKISKDIVQTLIEAGCFDSLGLNRPTALELWDTHRENLVSDDCFDVFKTMDKKEQAGKTKADWDIKIKRLKDIELYGYSLIAHPIDEYKNFIKTKQWLVPSDAKQIDSPGKFVMVGQITSISYAKTKDNKDFAWLELGDDVHTVKMPVWEDMLEPIKPDMQEGNIVLIKVEFYHNRRTGFLNIRAFRKDYENKKEKIMKNILTVFKH